jgi:hypothetical protein
MSSEAITLEVESDASSVFRSASSEDREEVVLLLSYWLPGFVKSPGPSLKEVMDEVGPNAKAGG